MCGAKPATRRRATRARHARPVMHGKRDVTGSGTCVALRALRAAAAPGRPAKGLRAGRVIIGEIARVSAGPAGAASETKPRISAATGTACQSLTTRPRLRA
jgi:hypothetical protein